MKNILKSDIIFLDPSYMALSAWSEHVPFAFWLMGACRPRVLVELGTHYGMSYFAFCQAAAHLRLGLKTYAIDTWKGDNQAGFYDEEVFQKVVAWNEACYSGFSTLVRSTFDDALKHFSEGSIDLLHIDGYHTYEAVKHDFENWLPKLSDRAVVVFHDTNVKEREFGVLRLFEELSSRYPHFEFFHGHGLGILGVGQRQSEELLELFAANDDEKSMLRRIFSKLGEIVFNRYQREEHELRCGQLNNDLEVKNRKLQAQEVRLSEQVKAVDKLTLKLAELTAFGVDTSIENYKTTYGPIPGFRYLLRFADKLVKRAQHDGRERIVKRVTKVLSESGLFDFEYYLTENPDVANSGVDPLRHFVTCGVYEGRKPNKDFDPVFYLGKYPDVLKSGMNPLLHYHQYGADEERVCNRQVDYQNWIETVEKSGLPTCEAVDSLRHRPLISIVMPVYNTPEIYLRACIDSVLAQYYPCWELCIADDKSSHLHVRKVLQEYADKDSRIRVVFREQNGHISRASNSALEIAKGEYIALLDHDDVLPEYALYFVALAIEKNPDVQILYSDEDKIDAGGKRFFPRFKSDWNPDLFYSNNYVSHLGVYRHELLNRIGGFRTGLEGSQDQDLLLRCLPHVRDTQIVHIPRVLYHWRTVEGSTALSSDEKSYTTEAGIKALTDYFAVSGPKGVRVETGFIPNTYRVRWPIPDPAPLVSLIIPTRDKKAITEKAVCSILEKTTYPNYEVLILDNGSIEPETLKWFDAIQQQDKCVRVIRYDFPFNYSAINNYGVQYARGSLIGLINNDVEVINPEWLAEMVSHALREGIGCVGAKLYYGNGTLQHAGVFLGIGGVAEHSHKYFKRNQSGYFGSLKLVQNFSAVTGACLLVRKQIYEMVGGLDELNLHVAFNDVDFCLKVREAGYRNLWTPYAELYHHESISRGREDTGEKQERFRKEVEFMKNKWGEQLSCDPYYSPNFTGERKDFSLSG